MKKILTLILVVTSTTFIISCNDNEKEDKVMQKILADRKDSLAKVAMIEKETKK